MEKKVVYVETSVVSYLANRPSRDIVVAAHQALTREWWQQRRSSFELRVSEIVLDEAGAGDAEAAAKRLAIIEGIQLIKVTDAAIDFADRLIQENAVPKEAAIDALHVALACVNGVHYLLTWNCRHIANAERYEAIQLTCARAGFRPPIICTPEELSGEH